MAISLAASASFGNGGKQFIARIVGRHPKFTFEREFIGRKGGKRNESSEAMVDDPGLYQVRDIGRKGNADDSYFVIDLLGDVVVKSLPLGQEEAMKIAKRLGDGESIGHICSLAGRPSRTDPSRTVYDVEIVTARQAEKAEVAKTIDLAVDACWAVLASLPQKEAKKVLSALRERLNPPKPPAAAGLAEESPAGLVVDALQDAGATAKQVGMASTPIALE